MTKLPDTITIDGVPYSRRDVIPAPIKPRQIDWSQVADIVPVRVWDHDPGMGAIVYPALSNCAAASLDSWTNKSLITGIWIPWLGGECPLPDGVIVDMALRHIEGQTGREAAVWNWHHGACDDDIIAFRVTGIAQGWVE